MTVIELDPAKRKRKVKVWVPPTAADFRPGRVIGIDQSLRATGAVALVCDEDGLGVVASVTLKTAQVALGPEDSLQRAVELGRPLRAFLGGYSRAEWAVAHELPNLIGKSAKTLRPESSWLAALTVRMVLADSGHELLPMVGATHWKKLVCGNGRATKAEAHGAMKAWASGVVQNIEMVTNEGERDALCVTLASIWGRA